ncbi:hypothetical protein Tco_1431421 [Tanacetum coccineum]
MVTTGSVIVTPGSIIMVTTGSVIVTPGSVIVTTGSVIVTTGSVIVTPGSVIVEHHHGQCRQYLCIVFIYVELRCHELRFWHEDSLDGTERGYQE